MFTTEGATAVNASAKIHANNIIDVKQGTQEWLQARCGRLGASRVHEALAKTKSGWGASRANLMAEIITERLTKIPAETFKSAAMEWGTSHEDEARVAYEFYADIDVEQVGLFRHPTIGDTHASPDGLVGDDGLLEIKCPSSATHIETLLGSPIAGKYVTQMMWQLACTGRKYCDFVSFDPRMPEHMQLFVKRVHRDNALIAELESEVTLFLMELRRKEQELIQRYSPVSNVGDVSLAMAG